MAGLLCAIAVLATLLATGCRARPRKSELRGPVYNLREGMVDAPVFGGQMYVFEAGPADAPPIVFVHGLGEGAARDFEPLFSALSKSYRLLAFDLPGFGRSSRAKDDYSPPRYAALIHRLVAQRLGRPATVVGHSMGGALAALYASEHPEEVERLALLDVAGILHYREYIRLFGGPRPNETVFERGRRRFKRLLLLLGLSPFSGTDMSKIGVDARSPMAAYLSSNALAAFSFIQYDFGPALRKIDVPAWIGWGRHDRVAPQRTAVALRYLLKTRNDHIYEGSEHVPMRSEPIRVLHTLQPFLAGERDVREEPRPLPESPPSIRCQRERGRVIEGDYDMIYIAGCKQVVLRNVRARALFVVRSEVKLENVEIRGAATAVQAQGATLVWTGGAIEGDVCLEAIKSRFNLMAVSCRFRSKALRVPRTSRLMASIGELSGPEGVVPLHGEYTLYDSPRGVLHKRE